MCNAQLEVTSNDKIEQACKLLAEHYYGKPGIFAYEAFDHINATFFFGGLPTPMLQWVLTPYGKCLGQTRIRLDKIMPPIIVLHPALLGGGPSEDPWATPRKYLGSRYAYETLLHECIHVCVSYLMGGETGESSHNSPEWISEVNRIAPMIGLNGIRAEMSKPKRVVIEGKFTKTGKPATKVQRVCEGNVPFDTVSRFPYAVRNFLGDMSIYQRNILPFTCSLPHYNGRVTHNCTLQNSIDATNAMSEAVSA